MSDHKIETKIKGLEIQVESSRYDSDPVFRELITRQEMSIKNLKA